MAQTSRDPPPAPPGKPSEISSNSPAEGGPTDAEGERTGTAPGARKSPQHCGPLRVERHRKADGRLLILYFSDEARGTAGEDG
jgi:hypothetical protein